MASGTSSSGETQVVSVLGEAKQVMQLFVEDDPTLNLNQTAIENAENVTGRLNQTLALACPTVSVQHERGGTVVTANLDRCTLDSGMVVSGQVSAKIARREIGANGELSVTFEFTQLTLGKLVVAGTVVVTTNNLKDYPIVANLQVTPLGTLAFQGTAAWTIGKPPEVTLNGTGEYQASSPPDTSNLTSNGWNCTANSPSTLYLAGLHRVYGDCHANAGSMSIKKTYGCSKTLRSQTFTQAVDAIVALTWSSATPTSDVVAAQLTTISNGQQRTAEPTPVTLPWHCD